MTSVNNTNVSGQGPEFNGPAGAPQDPNEAIQQLFKTLGVNFNLLQSQGQTADLSPEEILDQAEEIIQVDPEFAAALTSFLNVPNLNVSRDQTLQGIASILETRGQQPTPDTVREAFLGYASAVVNASNAQTATNINQALSSFTQSAILNILANVPAINPPDLPSGTNPANSVQLALDNKWFEPNPLAIFFEVVLLVAHVQAQIRFANGLEQSRLFLLSLDVAQERAEVIIEQGKLEAARQIAQAIVNLVTAAASIAIAAHTAYTGTVGARRSVQQKLDNSQTNPNYAKSEELTAAADKPSVQAQGVEKYNSIRAETKKLNEQKAKLQEENPNDPEIRNIESKISSLNKLEKKFKPGIKDIDAYQQEVLGNKPLPPELAKVRQEQNSIYTKLSDPNHFEEAVNTKINRVSSQNQALSQSISSLGQSVNGFISGSYENQIAQARAVDALLQEFQQSIGRFAQSTQSGRDEAAQQVRDFIDFLRGIIANYTGVFGFAGGRIA